MGSSFSVYNDTNHTVWIQQGENWAAIIGSVTALGVVATAGIGAAAIGASAATAGAVAAAEAAMAAGAIAG